MAKFIHKVDRQNQIFRLVIPRTIIKQKKWDAVQYVIIDDRYPDEIVIRRFVDDQTDKKPH